MYLIRFFPLTFYFSFLFFYFSFVSFNFVILFDLFLSFDLFFFPFLNDFIWLFFSGSNQWMSRFPGTSCLCIIYCSRTTLLHHCSTTHPRSKVVPTFNALYRSVRSDVFYIIDCCQDNKRSIIFHAAVAALTSRFRSLRSPHWARKLSWMRMKKKGLEPEY